MKKFFKITVLLVVILIGITFLGADVEKIYSLPSHAYVSKSDVENLNQCKTFGGAVWVNISDISVGSGKKTTAKMWLKLFGIIPIRQIEVELTDGEEVYLGGIPLGFAIKTQGLLVVGTGNVLAADGTQETISNNIKTGDFLLKINDHTINSSDDVPKILETLPTEKPVKLSLLRGDEIVEVDITPAKDTASGEQKLGLWVKNDASGIGTLTFIKAQDNRFGALGHAITDYETGAEIPVASGNIYKCSQVGINRAEKNHPGELRCVFLQGINKKGTIEKNTPFGVYGDVTELESIADFNRTAEIGSRLTIKTGKAHILSSVSGVLEEYEIEIIKTVFQPESDDKSFVFRVTDRRLLELTGGIVQGMSGSPIIQNGKLVGATTHVFVSDPTKGYGIYADWMAAQ
ncbi:MAG: SpoIVB peptidase [Clostridia bacterium]|nr:SpoIVB peptidase [Clostridia bacterium]